MKKIFSLMTILFFVSCQLKADDDLPNLGLIAHLIEVKCGAEQELIKALASKGATEKQKADAIDRYNEILRQHNRIIGQLIADIKTTNSKRKYRLLNKYYQKHKLTDKLGSTSGSIKAYILALKKLGDKVAEQHENFSAETVIAIVELGIKISEMLVEAHSKKVDATATILQALMLKSPSELIKPEEKKAEEKKSPEKKTGE